MRPARNRPPNTSLLSILASAMLPLGLSFLYGTTGSTQLPVIRMVLAGGRCHAGAASGPLVEGGRWC